MTPGTLLQEVSRFAAEVRDGDVRPEILQDGRRQITDIVGIALAASQMELARVLFKPYPANHFTHAGIDAAIRLREEGLDIE